MNRYSRGICSTLFAAASLSAGWAQAQCSSCATPTVAYSPVVVQNTTVRQGWYPGYLLDRMGQRLFGTTTVVPTAYTAGYPYTAAYPYTASYAAPSYTAAYPYTAGYAYTASYAPAYSYTAAYAPTTYSQTVLRPVEVTACNACACSPCACNTQTTYRPVTLAPVGGCSTCAAAATTSYDYAVPAAANTGCATCGAGYATPSSYEYTMPTTTSTTMPEPTLAQPSAPAAPQTFRKEPVTTAPEPEPATAVDANETSGAFQAPQLWNPRDRVTLNQPSGKLNTQVWQAVYRQPVDTQPVSQASAPEQPSGKLQWVAGR